MSNDDKDTPQKERIKSLVSSLLQADPSAGSKSGMEGSPAPAADASSAAAPSVGSAEDARELIDVYFELEEPEERDALFDQLLAIRHELVDAFLRTMMRNDEDACMRAAAAAELARRGDAEGLDLLEEYLTDADTPYVFQQALFVLGEAYGKAFYPTLQELWLDIGRPSDQRKEVMLAMETLDAARALGDFVAFIDALLDADDIEQEQDLVESAIMAFVRHNFLPAADALADLYDRVLNSPAGDPQARDELADLLREGTELLLADGAT